MTTNLMPIDLSKYSTAIISPAGQVRLLGPGDSVGLEKSPWKDLAIAFHGQRACQFKFSNGAVEGFVSNLGAPVAGKSEFELKITATE